MDDKHKGTFRVPHGGHWVRVSAAGYHTVETSIQVDGDTRKTIHLYPHRAAQEMREIPSQISGEPWHPPTFWQPQPTLIIGLGGTGRYVLTHLKKILLDAGAGQIPEYVRMALIDTSDYELLEQDQVSVSFAGVSLDSEEIVELNEDLHDLVEHLRQHPNDNPAISRWFPADEYAYRLSSDEHNLAHGTRQRRPLARAALIHDLQKGIPSQGVDVVLLIDRSGSMETPFGENDSAESRLHVAQKAALSFLSQMDKSTDRVAVIAFNEKVERISSFTQHFTRIRKRINALTPDSQTNLGQALQAAATLCREHPAPGRKRVVILLSDGESDRAEAIAQANKLKQSGVNIITIGIGEAEETLLQNIASQRSGQPAYYYAGNADELRHLYIFLARNMGDVSRIWRLLHGASSAALDKTDNALRVLLVASLAGGFGSALATDIAYLVKRVGQSLGADSISIEAYLTTHNVFSHISPRPDVLQANTVAAVREIERFQLAQGFPFRMAYDYRDPDNKALFGSIQWRLFDEIYLFDRIPDISPRTSSQEEVWYQPEYSVFPAMADAIAFTLDKASRTGAFVNYRRAIQGENTAEQWECGHAVSGSLGVYRYYLPVRDVFDMLRVRWAISLLRTWLTGNADESLHLSAAQNSEESEEFLEKHVRLFLSGYAGYENPACPSTLSLMSRVLTEGEDVNLIAIQPGTKEGEVHAYNRYLLSALQTILNGLTSSPIRAARGGKAGYALAFLDNLVEFLQDIRDSFLLHPEYQAIVDAYLDTTFEAKTSLYNILGLISSRYHDSDTPPPSSPGLLERLDILHQQAQQHLQEQDAVLTRESLLQPEDAERWYQEYFARSDAIDEMLEHLYWRVNPEGTQKLTLQFNAWNNATLENPKQKEAFLSYLLQAAGYVGHEMLEKETIQSRLAEVSQTNTLLEPIARQAWSSSKPLLSFSKQDAPHARSFLVLAAQIENGSPLEDMLRRQVTAERQFAHIPTTDPHSCTILQMLDVVPFSAVTSLREACHTYARWYGLLTGTSPDKRAEPTAVFHAERAAVQYERLLPGKLRQATRLFNPALVTALEEDGLARLYALALASGLILYKDNAIHVNISETHSLTIPISKIQGLNRRYSPYLVGMIYFIHQASESQIRALQQSLQTINPKIWQPWTTLDWHNREQAQTILATASADSEDFVAFLALTVREEFLKRKSS